LTRVNCLSIKRSPALVPDRYPPSCPFLRRFNHVRHVAPMCTPSNTCFLRSTGVHIVNGISIGSAVFAQLTAEGPYILPPLFPSKLPFRIGGLEPRIMHGSFGPTRLDILHSSVYGTLVTTGRIDGPCRRRVYRMLRVDSTQK